MTIEAFGRIAAAFPRHRLEIVGDGPLMAACAASSPSSGSRAG